MRTNELVTDRPCPSIFLTRQCGQRTFRPSTGAFRGVVNHYRRVAYAPMVLHRLRGTTSDLLYRLPRMAKVQTARLVGVLIVITRDCRPRLLVIIRRHPCRHVLFRTRILHLVGRRRHLTGPIKLRFPLFGRLHDLPRRILCFLRIAGRTRRIGAVNVGDLSFRMIHHVTGRFRRPLLRFHNDHPKRDRRRRLLILRVLRRRR